LFKIYKAFFYLRTGEFMARKKSTDALLKFTDSVGIEQASSVKQQISDSLKANKVTIVDFSELQDIDSSIIQLLLSAKQEADLLKKDFFVQNIPDNIKNLMQAMSVVLPSKKDEG